MFDRDLTTTEAAKLLQISENHMRHCCDRGMLRSYKIPQSLHRRIRYADAVAFAKEHGIPIKEQRRERADTI